MALYFRGVSLYKINSHSELSDVANRAMSRASYLSLVVSVILLAAKFWAFQVTHSQAVLSDAIESIVNVLAAAMAIWGIAFANKPADRDHPYGHGKIEFFSAAFEGGLITAASMVILVESIRSMFRGAHAQELGWGAAILFAAGIGNAGLGWYLIRLGKRHGSAAIEGSGRHVLSDFWTSAGVVTGLVLVNVTGFQWLDPLVAALVGLYLGWTGVKLMRSSVGGLLDEEDQEILGHLVDIVAARPPGIIQVHRCRVIRSGRYHHIDAHAVVPEFWNVAIAHLKTEEFEAAVVKNYPYSGELRLHVDPCRRAYCRECEVAECPIRRENFQKRLDLTIEQLTAPEEPIEFYRNS